MLTVMCLLAIAGFVATIVSALGKAPLWVAVVLISVAQLLTCLPLR